MKKFKRRYWLVLLWSFCAVVLLATGAWALFSWKNSSKTDHIVREKEAFSRLMNYSSEIHQLWIEGEESKQWQKWGEQCLADNGFTLPFDQSLLRCHPLILECLHRFDKKLGFSFVNPSSSDQKTMLYRYLTKSNTTYPELSSTGYLFTIEDKKSLKRMNVFLSDECHDFYLEKRAYAYGEEVAKEDDYRFDNFSQHIYIDRHLVTNDQINRWIDFGPAEHTFGLKKKTGDERFLPATSLKLIQMKNFCSFLGKQLLMAHYFDAATFLPRELSEVMPERNWRSPYYWTKKKSEFKKDCQLIYANECLIQKNYQLNFSTPSWTGLMDAMGGVMEVFRNPIDPESNLKASSFYFGFKSSWHKLGFRAYWDGEGFDNRHFDFKGLDPIIKSSHYQVAFRCMQERN